MAIKAIIRTLTIVLCIASAPLGAVAQDADEPEAGPSYERGGLAGAGVVLGAKVGGGFSQPFGDLGSSFLTELELGYTLPVARRSLEIFVSGGYTQPTAEGKGLSDARLPGPASYTLTQQEGMLGLGGRYRLNLGLDWLRPYIAAGPRVYFARTKISGKAGGEPFGENQENTTKLGAFGTLGAELYLGPGALLVEASLAWAKLDGYVLRNTSMGALGLSIGYRLFI
jgi:hypothetical protein